ncbi:MAG: hypothetical protein ACR2PX_00140 [Endozoicomonas sp.]|uniref:hypothetical protein n=1 Tax=Endozoicomonas sp. TaxID=1892382 RepID=UPI003D9B6013
MELFSNVNIDEVIFSSDGKRVTLKFIDMNEGEPAGVIQCSSVLSFNYQNTFDDNDGFAAYVGEVTCLRVDPENISSFLSKMNFKFDSFPRSSVGMHTDLTVTFLPPANLQSPNNS